MRSGRVSTFDRAAHCRRIASLGGQATVRIHGTSHMQTIGRIGFQRAIELGWGLELAKKLAPGYAAKFGRPLVLGAGPQRKARIRAQARRLFGGTPCDAIDCEERGQVHHLDIYGEWPNDGAFIRVLCRRHHIEEHRRIRRAHLRGA